MWIVRVSAWSTAVFTISSIGATAWQRAIPVALAVDLALFAAGCGALLGGYLRAIGRSRRESISLNGLFFLGDDVAPRPVVRSLRLLLAVQVVVALVTAGIRPFTALAFGVLVPTFGLGMMALWAAIHGQFGPREGVGS
jgi:hypothetical protein